MALFSFEVQERVAAERFLRVRAEEMLAGSPEVLRSLTAFLDLEWDERWVAHAGRRVDRWQHHTDREVDPLLAAAHPGCVRAASRLGYDLTALDVEALMARYRG